MENGRLWKPIFKQSKLDPSNWAAISNIALYYVGTGDFEKAMIWAKRELDVEPTNEWAYQRMGMIYLGLGRFQKAEQWLNKSLEIKPDFESSLVYVRPCFTQLKIRWIWRLKLRRSSSLLIPAVQILFRMQADVALWSGDYVKAREYYEKAIAVEPKSVEWVGAPLGYVLGKMGHQGEAQDLFDQSLKLNQKWIDQGDERSNVRREMALIHAAQGNKEEALHWLQEAINAGWWGYFWDEKSPLFENLHGEPRFQQMMAEVRAKVDKMRKRVEEMEKGWEQ